MNLESLFADVQRRADERFDDVLIRLLTSDIPEMPEVPDHCCAKCGLLLREYVRCKIALHRYRRRHGDDFWGHRSCSMDCITILEARVRQARAEFHAVVQCTCGLQLWRGRRWREKQAQSYRDTWLAYVTQTQQENRT